MAAPRLLRTLSVEHRALRCARSFDEVHRALIESVPTLKPEVSEILVRGEKEKVAIARREWPKLWLFLVRNHGELTAADGLTAKAMQYEIGNPLTAELMTRHVLAAALYAPLRVILYEDARGPAIFEYDLPSSLFGQFGDERVAQVGRELDAELEAVLRCERPIIRYNKAPKAMVVKACLRPEAAKAAREKCKPDDMQCRREALDGLRMREPNGASQPRVE